MKDLAKACETSDKSADCQFGNDVINATTKARAAAGYYELTDVARTSWDTLNKVAETKLKVDKVDAYYAANIPVAGKEGSACVAKKCTVETHCCGTLAAGTGNIASKTLENRCAPKAGMTDPWLQKWTMTCGAQKLFAVASAAAVAVYMM